MRWEAPHIFICQVNRLDGKAKVDLQRIRVRGWVYELLVVKSLGTPKRPGVVQKVVDGTAKPLVNRIRLALRDRLIGYLAV